MIRPPTLRRASLAAAAFGVATAWAALVGAQPADDGSRSVARALGQEGIELLDRGDYATALDRFERALAIVAVPTMGVRAGRCLVQLGRWVEASERYRLVGAMTIDAASPPAFRAKQLEAQAEAAREREALMPRIPGVTVTIEGLAASEIALQLDGKPVPSAVVGARLPIDPGTHRLEAIELDRADGRPSLGRRAVASVAVSEGETKTAVLHFDPQTIAPPGPAASGPLAPPAPPTPFVQGHETAPPPDRRPGNAGSPRRTAGFVAIGVGAAAVTGGVIAWGVALGKGSDLEAACGADGECPRALAGDLDSYEAWRTASAVLLATGAVVAAAGVVVVLTAPSRPRTALYVGPSGLHLRRSF